MQPQGPFLAASAAAPAAEIDDLLLATLPNYDDGAFDATSVAAPLEALRSAGWVARAVESAFSAHGHCQAADARAGFARQLRLLYDVGRGSLPLGRIYEGHVNALELVARFATPAQRLRFHADAQAGRMFGVWNTEAGDGVRLRAVGDGLYELDGAKTFCSGAFDVTRPIITGHRVEAGSVVGWQMVIVTMELLEASRIDTSFWAPLGMEPSASHRVDFTGLRLGADSLLGVPDDYRQEPHFSGGAVRFAAVQLGGARALFDHAVALLKATHREHDPYQCHRIGRMELAHQSGLHWLALAASYALPGWNDDASVLHYANMMRTAVLDACNRILDETEQAVGARGFLTPRSIQRIYRDLKMYLRQPAPDGALAAVGRHAAERAALPEVASRSAAACSQDSVGALPVVTSDEPPSPRWSALEARARAVDAGGFAGPVLALVPHADDETLGFGGLYRQLMRRGVEVDLVLVTDGVGSHPGARAFPAERRRDVREAEFLDAIRRLGGDGGAVWFWRQPDTQLPHLSTVATAAAVAELTERQVRRRYGTVLTPWRRDPHGDHNTVTSWVLQMVDGLTPRERPRVVEYFVWLGHQGETDLPADAADLVKVDVSAERTAKREALAAHRSQLGGVFDDPTGFALPSSLVASVERRHEYFVLP